MQSRPKPQSNNADGLVRLTKGPRKMEPLPDIYPQAGSFVEVYLGTRELFRIFQVPSVTPEYRFETARK